MWQFLVELKKTCKVAERWLENVYKYILACIIVLLYYYYYYTIV